MVANGTLVWYYFVCKREVWLMGRGLIPPQDNPLLDEGRTISEIFFKRLKNYKEILIDGKIKVDILRKSAVMEVKKSSKYLEASVMQLKFYLYYFRKFKGLDMVGYLVFPKERRKMKVKLEDRDISMMESVIQEIERIVGMDSPPPPKRIPYCKNCAFKEICWV